MSFHDAMSPDELPLSHQGEWVPEDEPELEEGGDDDASISGTD